MEVVKLTASGNDFLFIDARGQLPPPFAAIARAELARKLCDRHWGVGADGIVLVESSSVGGRYKWDFYNSDGSPAEMCGNASRCMGRWAERTLGLKEIEFETAAGLIRSAVVTENNMNSGLDDQVAAHLDFIKLNLQPIEYLVSSEPRQAYLINTGVPHIVAVVDGIASARLAGDDIRALRFHAKTGRLGANVTFLEVRGPRNFATVTFERGIEDFTLSCGTGVLAAAAVGLMRSAAGYEADVETPGGKVSVRFGKNWQGAVLQGPARFLFAAQIGASLFIDGPKDGQIA